MADEKSFESSLKELEQIVEQIEAGNLPLERSLELFEKGVRLSRECQARLDDAERKVEMLLKGSDGSLKTAPFHEPEND
jgi:exodeoxyribonuclease VII small subunit